MNQNRSPGVSETNRATRQIPSSGSQLHERKKKKSALFYFGVYPEIRGHDWSLSYK